VTKLKGLHDIVRVTVIPETCSEVVMSDFEFMTYEAAAERLKIAVSSVKRQAARRKWPKRQGNDGRVTVGIPVSRLSDGSQIDSHPDSQGDTVSPKGQPSISTELLIQSLRDLIEAERRRADAAESDRDAWHAMAERLANENSDLVAAAQRSWWKQLLG
jgi:hypothetical protein